MKSKTVHALLEQFKTGTQITVERQATVTSDRAPSNRVSKKTISEIKQKTQGAEGVIVRFKGSSRSFRMYRHDESGAISIRSMFPRPLAYEVA